MNQEENILNNYNEDENFLMELPKEMPFSVPDNYFDTLRNRIINSIQLEEDAAILIPELNRLNKTMPNAIPRDYFEKLTVTPPKQATIVRINYLKQIFAAAVFIGVLFSTIAIWNVQRKPDISAQISNIKTEDLLNHLDTAVVSFSVTDEETDVQGIVGTQEDLQLASDEDLQDYINDNVDILYNNIDI